jgi:SAM-dependent methyltransferase
MQFTVVEENLDLLPGAGESLKREYRLRFSPLQQYRDRVWQVLTPDFFQRLVPPGAALLDLGSGWGEFINHIQAGQKYAMDLNPDGAERVGRDVQFLNQDCSQKWALPDSTLDVVFTSNFFEHLPAKADLERTLVQVHRCLKPGGRLICMGPNIRCVAGRYWDFWDHHIPLSDLSLTELLQLRSFQVEKCWPRFLPYTMVHRRRPPLFFLKLYLKFPLVWRLLGRQFLIVARAEK